MNERSDEERINEMIEVIMKVARGNYSNQVQLTGKNDDLDSLAMGLNMMIDDIEMKNRGLEESEKKFRNFFEFSPVYCYMVSPDGKILDINKSALIALGYSKKVIVNKPLLTSLYSKQSQEKAKEAFKKWKKTGHLENVELEIIMKNGEKRDVLLSVQSVIGSKGELLHSISVQRDITERKKAEEALKASEERYRDLFESAHDLIQGVRPDGSLLFVNKAWKTTLGYHDQEIGKITVFDILHPDYLEEARNMFALVQEGECIENIEMVIVSKDGKEIHVEANVDCKFEDGEPIALRAILRDITARVKAEEELKRSLKELDHANVELKEADKMKDQFLSITSHELRNPLAGIIGVLELLKEGLYKDEEDLMGLVDTMYKTSEDMIETLNNLLDLQMIESGKMEPKLEEMDVKGLLDDVYFLYGRKLEAKGVELRIERNDIEDTMIRTDTKMVKQVLRNVVGNSVKFTDSGSISVSVKKNGDDIEFQVTDTGAGIAPKDIPLLFQPFSQVSRKTENKVKGSGLGLAITKSLVEALGGKIRIESEGEGKGTKVSFTIPLEMKHGDEM
jgi:PAS domain S-box-containing protein